MGEKTERKYKKSSEIRRRFGGGGRRGGRGGTLFQEALGMRLDVIGLTTAKEIHITHGQKLLQNRAKQVKAFFEETAEIL